MQEFSVLLIDDSEIDRYILKRTVEEIELIQDVLEAENGKEAIDFLNNYEQHQAEFKDKFPPIIIFLDINMPLLNGFEFLEVFSKLRLVHEGYKESYVVMYSSSNNSEDRSKASQYQFVHDFVVKGENTTDELQAKIKHIIENRMERV